MRKLERQPSGREKHLILEDCSCPLGYTVKLYSLLPHFRGKDRDTKKALLPETKPGSHFLGLGRGGDPVSGQATVSGEHWRAFCCRVEPARADRRLDWRTFGSVYFGGLGGHGSRCRRDTVF